MFTTSSLYCYIPAVIFICCRWWSSHKYLNGWIYLRWSLIKQLRSPIIKYLERITILYVNIDKASNAYCLATLINTRCNKQKISLDYWSKSNENDKTGINRFFLITNFCVKIVAIVANTKKNLVGAYWLKIKIKKEQTLLIWWLSVGLQTVW